MGGKNKTLPGFPNNIIKILHYKLKIMKNIKPLSSYMPQGPKVRGERGPKIFLGGVGFSGPWGVGGLFSKPVHGRDGGEKPEKTEKLRFFGGHTI